MKSALLLLACGVLIAFIGWREWRDRRDRQSRQAMIDQLRANSRRFLNELMGDEQPELPVRAVMFASDGGPKLLWEVTAKDDAERADIIASNPVFAPSIWREI